MVEQSVLEPTRLVVGDPLSDAYGDAVVVLHHLAELVAVALQDAAAGGAAEASELAAAPLGHEQQLRLAALDLVDGLVQLIQGEGAAVGSHSDRLAGGARLVDAVKGLGSQSWYRR